jgi:hypothetical protein
MLLVVLGLGRGRCGDFGLYFSIFLLVVVLLEDLRNKSEVLFVIWSWLIIVRSAFTINSHPD